MASSYEEGEIFPEIYVIEYVFLDQNEKPVSFADLPLQWSENEVVGDLKTDVYLHGIIVNGLQNIYEQVVAWKFDISYIAPEILVLTKDKRWLTLQKPRKSFESTVRTILITIYWMHLIKRSSEPVAKYVWNYLRVVFSSFEFKTSEEDLLCHKLLILEAMKRDRDLAISKDILNFIKIPHTCATLHQDVHTPNKKNFIVHGEVEREEDYCDDDDKEEEVDGAWKSIFDPVCAICDNGGNVLCCEGRCLRSFHPTKADGIDNFCESLGFVNNEQVEDIVSFLCKNCIYKQHQCYACGELGSSNSSFGQEVFLCASATCGHFYHPKCAAKLLQPDNEAEAKRLRQKISAGDSFTCPMHKCFVCRQSENTEIHDLQFAVCRRCPKVYHRKCLPKNIYENNSERVWCGLLPCNRILIYCMEHKIIKELGTPSRDHLIFPCPKAKEINHELELLSDRGKILGSKRNEVFEDFATSSKNLLKKPELVQMAYDDIQDSSSRKRTEINGSKLFSPLKKPRMWIPGRMFSKQDTSFNFDRSLGGEENNLSQTEGNLKETNPFQAVKAYESNCKIKNTFQNVHVRNEMESTKPSIDAEIDNGILALMKGVDSSFNVEEFMKRQQQFSSAKARIFKGVVNQSITVGRVEASVEAARTALAKLEAGDSLEDVKAVCGLDVLRQIFKWKVDLTVYLSPFLCGMRYTSFGRYFTNLDKLKEIVGRLHCYVQNGDTIVDFCCGSNDFSCLLKENLEKVGKSCSFKNYDLFQPKNDFSFEQKDWMSVNVDELPDGSKLVMGLNPPFGYKASGTNTFIKKALEFRPKLIILIAPKEAKRLDRIEAYDLIWKDKRVLFGKSFYLPGIIDIHDKPLEQWSMKPPLLYLWSRSDWTRRHKAIARERGHA